MNYKGNFGLEINNKTLATTSEGEENYNNLISKL